MGGELKIGVGVERFGVASEHLREARGILNGQGMQEDGVDDGEDGGVGADAESEGENRNDGKARTFLQHAHATAQVLTKRSGHSGTSRAHMPAS